MQKASAKAVRDAIKDDKCKLFLTKKHRVLDKFKVENITKAKITDTVRIEKNLVEDLPLREAIINAIVHNDYSHEYPPVFEIFSDRIEITSYGGLIQGQSESDFFSGGSMPRNRELMRIFKDVDLVEQLGSGMNRILKVYDKSVFKISEHFIRVVFPFAEVAGEPLNELRDTLRIGNDLEGIEKNETRFETRFETSMKQVLKQKDYKKLETVIKKLSNEELISIQEVMELTHKSRTTAWRYMQLLVECGAVEAVGNTNNVSYKKI